MSDESMNNRLSLSSSASSVFTNVLPVITGFWNNSVDSENNLKNLANKEILQIGNVLSGIFSDNNKFTIDPPRLVVVGTQSSGKSSLLNYSKSCQTIYQRIHLIGELVLQLSVVKIL